MDKIISNYTANLYRGYSHGYICCNNDNCITLRNGKLLKIFKNECEKHNLLYKMEDIINDYKGDYKVE